jgi:hypothetical protein
MHPRMAIVAATGTARKRVIPAVRERQLCTIVAIHGRDPQSLRLLPLSTRYHTTLLMQQRCWMRQSRTLFSSDLRPSCIRNTYGYARREIFRSCARSRCACRHAKPQLFSLSCHRVSVSSKFGGDHQVVHNQASCLSLAAAHIACLATETCSDGALGQTFGN